MKNKLFIILVAMLLNISSCKSQEAEFMGVNGLIFNSTYSIIYESSKNITPEELKKNIEEIFYNYRASISSYVPTSIMNRINRNEDAQIDAHIEELYNMSVMISELSGGAFDITVGPLVRAWGFGADGRRSFSGENLDSLLNLVGMDKVKIVDGKIVKSNPNIVLDFNAIAKGFSVDLIARHLDKLGIKNYLIEVGGELRVKGTRNGNLWRVGIDKPLDSNITKGSAGLQAIVSLTNKSSATSGDYRRFYIGEDGVKYSHTIDPRTGYPVRNRLLSITVFADECAIADGIATVCMVLGHEKAIEFLNNHPQYSAFMVYSGDNGEFETWMSESLREFIEEE